ncbi:DUF1345 domain-containing protein [Sinorhizobium numidicum]|uniref:DUF1345 domain-containing protein n=1 Tax=Sinorhizobium numidicum TaxID=680248 RepID=A0ABY8CXQ7_9HYPH|nr:DUF1345 domain-containing protein [Sinorhizobium numidicum]WEX78721.1 DUF1345 domain-containing protein [Sinorhizobium numidicum]WEX82118.1 DUF1345 domain-containing protein [Sinorhizobium numidicum]
MNSKTRLRHWPFYFALAGAFLSLPVGVPFFRDWAIEIAAILFFCIYLSITTFRLPNLTGSYLKANARDTGEPEPIIFLVTLSVAAVSLVALFLALNRAGGGSGPELILTFASVTLGWATIHTMAALHYAHLYWLAGRHDDGSDPAARGLAFPGTDMPGGHDFLYFAFVIGMTAQTSDVAITTTAMRRFNLTHAVVSFFFNTVLVAAAVNAAVQLAGGVPPVPGSTQ